MTVPAKNIPAQVRVLTALHTGPLTLAELRDVARTDVVARLVERGWLAPFTDADTIAYGLTETGAALAVPTDPARLAERVVFMYRLTGQLVRPILVTDTRIAYGHINEAGLWIHAGGATALTGLKPRWSPVDEFAALHVPYRPCRWTLDCPAQAVTTVTLDSVAGGPLDACASHARDHRAWDREPRRDRGEEPLPDCMCPDGDGDRMYVDYCPRHGTPAWRGIELDPGELLDTPATTAQRKD